MQKTAAAENSPRHGKTTICGAKCRTCGHGVFRVFFFLVKGSLVKCYVVCQHLGVRGLLLLSLWFSMKCLAFESDSLMHLSPYMIQKEFNSFFFFFFFFSV